MWLSIDAMSSEVGINYKAVFIICSEHIFRLPSIISIIYEY